MKMVRKQDITRSKLDYTIFMTEGKESVQINFRNIPLKAQGS